MKVFDSFNFLKQLDDQKLDFKVEKLNKTTIKRNTVSRPLSKKTSTFFNISSFKLPSSVLFTKRRKIAFSAIALGLIFIYVTQNSNILYKRNLLLPISGVITYILSVWCLREDLNKTKLILLFILPTFFTVSITSFYYVLRPDYIRWLTRIPFAIVYSVIIYFILLSQNVFNISSQRTIPLYRAATTSSLLFTLITAVLIFSVVSTMRLSFYVNGLIIFLLSFCLVLQVLWAIQVSRVTMRLLFYSFSLSLLIGQFAIILSFWPIVQLLWGISLASILYTMLGITISFLKERVIKREIAEYCLVGGILFFVSLGFTLFNWIPAG